VLRRFATSLLIALLALPVAARTRPHYGGTLHVEIEGDPWQRPDGLARRLVFNGLTVLDANGELRPALSTEWSSDDSDHRWQFKLRPGVHFHDGTALTSVNVVASLTTACSTNCPWTSLRAVGSSVVFVGDSPMPNLPALLASDEFLIALTITSDGKTPNGNIGTGPFQLTGFNNGVLSFSANDACWQGRPFADGLEIRVHRAIRDQWLDLGVGRADVVEVPAEMLRQAQQQRLTVVASRPVSLLALQVSDSGPLANPMLRASIAAAVDRGTLYNVIFQKQGQITASLLPQSLTGYAFLFPPERDLNKAHELKGGLSTPPLTLAVNGSGAVQLAAQRIALDLREAGFNVVLTSTNAHPDLLLRKLPLEGAAPEAALDTLLRSAGLPPPILELSPSALFNAERELLDRHTLIPLLDLPRAYASGGRVRDLHLRADGTPDLANVSLEDAP
jgi:MarR-like DNA-binding transcriptional regulator SgrR of sgrS sRNA